MFGFSYPGQTYPAGFPFVGVEPWLFGNVVTMEGQAVSGPSLVAEGIAGPALSGEALTILAQFGSEAMAAPSLASQALSGPAFMDEELI